MATYEDYCKQRGIPYTPPPKPPEQARHGDGRFVADDPNTPDVNEAFVKPVAEKTPPKKTSKAKKSPKKTVKKKK